jgi:hypothetical protein
MLDMSGKLHMNHELEGFSTDCLCMLKRNRYGEIRTTNSIVSQNIETHSDSLLVLTSTSPFFTVTPRRTVVDEEHLLDAVDENSQDCIVSNMGLHWVNDLPGSYENAHLSVV